MGQSGSSTPDLRSSVPGHDPHYRGCAVWEHSSGMKGSCRVSDPGVFLHLLQRTLLEQSEGKQSTERGSPCHTTLLTMAFCQGKMSPLVFVRWVPLSLTSTVFLHWLHSCKGALLHTHRDTDCSLRCACFQDTADCCHITHNYISASSGLLQNLFLFKKETFFPPLK